LSIFIASCSELKLRREGASERLFTDVYNLQRISHVHTNTASWLGSVICRIKLCPQVAVSTGCIPYKESQALGCCVFCQQCLQNKYSVTFLVNESKGDQVNFQEPNLSSKETCEKKTMP